MLKKVPPRLGLVGEVCYLCDFESGNSILTSLFLMSFRTHNFVREAVLIAEIKTVRGWIVQSGYKPFKIHTI